MSFKTIFNSGNESDAKNCENLEKKGIYYILNVTKNIPFYNLTNSKSADAGRPFVHKRIAVNDCENQNLKNHFGEASHFIGKYKTLILVLTFSVLTHPCQPSRPSQAQQPESPRPLSSGNLTLTDRGHRLSHVTLQHDHERRLRPGQAVPTDYRAQLDLHEPTPGLRLEPSP